MPVSFCLVAGMVIRSWLYEACFSLPLPVSEIDIEY